MLPKLICLCLAVFIANFNFSNGSDGVITLRTLPQNLKQIMIYLYDVECRLEKIGNEMVYNENIQELKKAFEIFHNEFLSSIEIAGIGRKLKDLPGLNNKGALSTTSSQRQSGGSRFPMASNVGYLNNWQ